MNPEQLKAILKEHLSIKIVIKQDWDDCRIIETKLLFDDEVICEDWDLA